MACYLNNDFHQLVDEAFHPARNSWHRVLVFIILNSLVWWATFSVSRHYLDGSDMVENYAWGINWQWGTNKHPPLFGWITAAWFTLFPTTDWAYYLLNELSLGVAFVLLALAMRRVLTPQRVFVALTLTALATCFGADSGYKYNADTAQLPFIAGFLWAVLVAVQERRWGYYLLAGALGKLCKSH
jgi:4-amino-4-deoxy-L-arabinose transferase-like glycosyltransferase